MGRRESHVGWVEQSDTQRQAANTPAGRWTLGLTSFTANLPSTANPPNTVFCGYAAPSIVNTVPDV